MPKATIFDLEPSESAPPEQQVADEADRKGAKIPLGRRKRQPAATPIQSSRKIINASGAQRLARDAEFKNKN